MKIPHRLLVIALTGSSWMPVSLRADSIELKTGERIDGVFKQATAAGAVIEVAGQAVTIPTAKVRAIYFGAPPSALKRPDARMATLSAALDGLHSLKSVTESGVSYRDYSPRVLDVRVAVDRFLAQAEKDPQGIEKLVSVAMRSYEIASLAWSLKISDGALGSAGVAIVSDPEIPACPGIKVMIQESAPGMVEKMRSGEAARTPQLAYEQLTKLGSAVAESPGALWSCASAAILEADKVYERKK